MELLFYVIGNFFVNWSAVIPLGFWTDEILKRQQKLADATEKSDPRVIYKKVPGCVSSDLQIILFFGTLFRCYWSCVPPVMWEDETSWFIILLAKCDVLFSPVIWGFLCLTVACSQERTTIEESMPFYLRWKFLVFAAVVVGIATTWTVPSIEMHEGWKGADVCVVANMFGDAFAMIPQMYLVTYEGEKPKGGTSHFVGLLCIGRVFRMMFWFAMIWEQYQANTLDREHQIWVFVFPDIVHSLVMADFLWIWLKKVKKEQIDPRMERLAIV